MQRCMQSGKLRILNVTYACVLDSNFTYACVRKWEGVCRKTCKSIHYNYQTGNGSIVCDLHIYIHFPHLQIIKPSAMNLELWTWNYEMETMSWRLWSGDYELKTMNSKQWIRNYALETMNLTLCSINIFEVNWIM